jgi:hypothetical protein
MHIPTIPYLTNRLFFSTLVGVASGVEKGHFVSTIADIHEIKTLMLFTP